MRSSFQYRTACRAVLTTLWQARLRSGLRKKVARRIRAIHTLPWDREFFHALASAAT